MKSSSFKELKQDCKTNPTQFNLGYIQAMYDTMNITQKQYYTLTDLIENSNDYRDI